MNLWFWCNVSLSLLVFISLHCIVPITSVNISNLINVSDCGPMHQTPLKKKKHSQNWTSIGGLSKNSPNLTWFHPNPFDFMGFRDMYSNNNSAVSIVNLFPMCKARPQCVVTLKYMFTAVVTLENGS